MTNGNGTSHCTLPIFACFVGDYSEQVLFAGCKTGECPKCDVNRNNLGDLDTQFLHRDLQKILDALSTLDTSLGGYYNGCSEAGIKPVTHPLWEGHRDIYLSPTPANILHQLYHEGLGCYSFRPRSCSPGCRSSCQCSQSCRARGGFEECPYPGGLSQHPAE